MSEACGVEHPGLIGPTSVEVLDNLADGRPLDLVYGYEGDWGFPSQRDRAEISRIMAATDEPESHTEGPPETAEEGQHGDEQAGEGGTDSVDV